MTDTSHRRATVDVNVRRVQDYARRANSEDSIEVLSTTESIFPEDLTAITEEEAEHQPLSNGFEKEEEILTDYKRDRVPEEQMMLNASFVNDGETEGPVQEGNGCVDREESLKQTPLSGEVIIKEERVFECLKSKQVYEDKPEKMSRVLQGKASARIFMSNAPFKTMRLALLYTVSLHPNILG